MPDDPHDLNRFLVAQAPVWPQVVAELTAGRKRSHWMWFVFPQLKNLGRSEAARFYGIASLSEARAYLAHPVLGPRLHQCTGLVMAAKDGATALGVFGSPDDLKFRSCMTLFQQAAGAGLDAPFKDALARYFEGRGDPLTLDHLVKAQP